MSKPNPRLIALDALRAWDQGHGHAEDILAALCQRRRLAGPDRALAQSLCYGVLRHLSRLDGFIDLLRQGAMSRENRRVLRLGLFQLYHAGIAPHAAVNETVALARGTRGVINGILRAAIRRRAELEALAAEWPPEQALSHPRHLIDRWSRAWGEEMALQLCEWNNRPPPVYARACGLAPGGADAAAILAAAAPPPSPVAGRPGFYLLGAGPPPAEWMESGLVYIQDPSTALACDLLDPRPGERVLDACAAPGGKTALLRELARGQGELVAADASPARLELLRRNLNRLGLRGIRTEMADWERPSQSRPRGMAPFDAILADVPCSNTGVIRRRVDVRWRLEPADFHSLPRRQLAIAEACLGLLKPGGRLVYSTCSLEEEENRAVVEGLLKRHRGRLELEATAECLPWRDGFDGAFAARLRVAG